MNISLDSPEIIANPYPVYKALRDQAPVYWYAPMRTWLVSRAEDVRQLLKDSRISAGGSRFTKGMAIFPEEVRAKFQPLAKILGRMMLFHDHPEHTRLRRHLNAPFSRAQVDQLRRSIQSAVDSLIQRFSPGRVELISQFARPLPAEIICEMLAVPVSDRERLVRQSDDLADFFVAAPPNLEQLERAQESTICMEDYFEKKLRVLDLDSRDSLLTLLASFGGDTDGLTNQEIAAQCILLMFGGQETVRNTIGNGCYCLLLHPEQLEMIRNRPELWQPAIDEVLRWQSPIQFVGRMAKEAISLREQTIAAGDPLLLLLGAANRDPSLYENPDSFDIQRKPGHSSFGHGAHKCIGEWLARVESEIALSTLFEKLPGLTFEGGQPEWIDHLALRGFKALPLKWNIAHEPRAD